MSTFPSNHFPTTPMALSMAASANPRPVPYIKIIHQPSQVYRMRYKAEKRTTFLYAENFQTADKGNKAGDGLSSTSAMAAKKAAPLRKKAVVGPGASEHPDGMFPKIEV